ncbi:non-homologous end-joining DNA ligase [Henriciella aquimarina]|uniref:non-homologous end-joining DNA ligase n=1 Tax=Henriciella aquimarina TaxID=545261 RepID=UPI000A01320A|nr:non-homologous end-joining DNA ligase [Henriciella aquimarina]
MPRRNKDTLDTYRQKRDFSTSPEPDGKASKKAKTSSGKETLAYAIQKHDATRLHYDLRLELDGVLKSWAITKGPSLNPSDKRLAVRTEDHPLDYGGFEGVIPEGYGAGTVMLWDRGGWVPHGDPHKGLEEGVLKFELKGERLKGGWALIRMKTDDSKENWLLVKERDEHADEERDPRTAWQASVVSGRDFEEIAEAADAGDTARQTGASKAKAVKDKPSHKHTSEAADEAAILGVRITHPDRVVYDEQGATKREIAAYYAELAPRMLPHIKDRPVSLVRCPSGAGGKCFFQKHHTDSIPEAIGETQIKEKDGETASYLLLNSPEALVSAAQIGALELHIWGARTDKLERPDRLVIDLDPDEGMAFSKVKEAAVEIRDVLEKAGLKSFALLTGGKGIHVVAPLERRRDWDEVKQAARGLARSLADADPETYVAEASKAKRKGRIFIDWLRNERGSTAICPYSLRARPGAPVATPVRWDELSGIDSAAQYTLSNIRQRLSSLKSPPWEGYDDTRQSITSDLLERFRAQD